jgi:sec-independent protein translocase protein TatA
MGSFSIWHWLIVLLVAAIFFGGRGKITNVMSDFAKGIKAFKAGMKDEDTAENKPAEPPQVTAPPAAPPHTTTGATQASDVHSKA